MKSLLYDVLCFTFCLVVLGSQPFAVSEGSRKRGRCDMEVDSYQYVLESFLDIFGDHSRPAKVEQEDLSLLLSGMTTVEAKVDYSAMPQHIAFQQFEEFVRVRNFEKLEEMIEASVVPKFIDDLLIEGLIKHNDDLSLYTLKLLLQFIPNVSESIMRRLQRIVTRVVEYYGDNMKGILEWLDRIDPTYSWRVDDSVFRFVVSEMIVRGDVECAIVELGRLKALGEAEKVAEILDSTLLSLSENYLWKPVLGALTVYNILRIEVNSENLFIFLKAAYADCNTEVTQMLLGQHGHIALLFEELPFVDLENVPRYADLIYIYLEFWLKHENFEKFVAMLDRVNFAA